MERLSTTHFLTEDIRGNYMKIKYFSDTDTALIEMAHKEVYETREVNPNIYIDLDEQGNLVNITIEHAKENTSLPEFSYEEIINKTA